ncbi:ferric reductase transmembrane component [Pyrenophora tritici-repentis]|nr:ferric reductase transmembrane component [Pyrenophora tritici-repentis]
MAFGYEFVVLDDEAERGRRQALDWYALVAQLSVIAVLAAAGLGQAVSWLAKHSGGHRWSRSQSLQGQNKKDWILVLRSECYKLKWWLGVAAAPSWGTRGEWIGGTAWTIWLLYLCIAQTGNDYLHLTKRLGAVGASQLPLHYLLAMRTPYSPIQYLTQLSYEQLQPWHRILGRIVFVLFALHATLYTNFFVQSRFLAKRVKDTDVIFGIISIIMFFAISIAAIGALRKRNYRVFYLSHVAIANLVVVPLYLHTRYIRPFIWETITVIALHSVFRIHRVRMYRGTIELIPWTSLVKVRIPLEAPNSVLPWRPGQHVYLRRPSDRQHSAFAYKQFLLWSQTNPLTIASVPCRDNELVLVAKTRQGNTKKMAELANSSSRLGQTGFSSIPLMLEGPYGATCLPNLSFFNTVLLVAGGVGATFTLPIYQSIVRRGSSDRTCKAGGARVRFIWAVKRLAEAQWAFPMLENGEEAGADPASCNRSIAEVFVTQPSTPSLSAGGLEEDVELVEADQLPSADEQIESPTKRIVWKFCRPDIPAIVDEAVSSATSIAVISCGPRALSEQLHRSLHPWVMRNHEVYWHNEGFGH